MTNLDGKFRGAMVGSALGDAIGELAFAYPEERLLRSELKKLSIFRYTDDTAMAIGLAESIIERGGIEPQALGDMFSRNFEREPWRGYACGPPTVFSMVKKTGTSYPEAAASLFGGKGSLGNGAAMRIAPVGLFYRNSEEIYEYACKSAMVTHAHPVGMDGAAVQAFAVAQAVRLNPKEKFPLDTFIRQEIRLARTPEIRGNMELVRELIIQDVPPDIAAQRVGRTVAVHESMPFAVYSFLRHAGAFEDCIFCAIMNGGDRDTLGAMAGAISGAYLGIESIPRSWWNKLENRNYIESLAVHMAEKCTA